VTASGFGANAENINLVANSGEICAQVEMNAYGSFTCFTNAGEISQQGLAITAGG